MNKPEATEKVMVFISLLLTYVCMDSDTKHSHMFYLFIWLTTESYLKTKIIKKRCFKIIVELNTHVAVVVSWSQLYHHKQSVQMRTISTWPSERKGDSTGAAWKHAERGKCCRRARDCPPEQLRLQSRAREHFPSHNSSPRCMIIPRPHRKQNKKPFNVLPGYFSQGQVYRMACLLKELLPCFLYLFSNYQFPIQLKCVKMFLTWSLYVEIVFRSWA